jgi:hypothetical protein
MIENIVSICYPNSGSNWLRMMTNHLGLPLFLNNSHQGSNSKIKIDDIILYNNKFKDRFKNKKIIFMHRDPRDVVVSNYFQWKYRQERNENLILTNFIKEEETGIEKIIRFNLYWKEFKCDKISISYEDLKSDTKLQLIKIFDFVMTHYDIDKLQESIELYSFEKMHQREKNKNIADNSVLLDKVKKIYNITNTDIPDSFKVRRGIVGGYVDYMNNGDIEYCDEMLSKHNYFERMKE